MPKKPSNVFVNESCVRLITEYCDSADISKAAFSRRFGKHDRWVSELARGRSMPSPDEAARMCAMLKVQPEDILQVEGNTKEGTEKRKADIALVNSLLEQEKGIKKQPAANSDELTDTQKTAIDMIKSMSDSDLEMYLEILKTIKKKKAD